MIKKIVAITLAIFFLAVIIIVGLGLFSGSNQPTTNNQSLTNQQTNKLITSTEVAKHNTSNDCWIIVNNKIYDVSQYLKFNLHPGENATITPYCGKEATRAFDTKDRSNPKPHSTNANSMLTDYYVGDLAL